MRMSLSVCQVLESVENEGGPFPYVAGCGVCDGSFGASRVYGIGPHDLFPRVVAEMRVCASRVCSIEITNGLSDIVVSRRSSHKEVERVPVWWIIAI